MDEKATPHNSKGIRIYPAVATKEPKTPNNQVRKGIALLLTRKKVEEILYIHSGEGLKLMHLRYDIDDITIHKIWLMFKRTPEIRPYYSAIKTWCETNGLSWKDKTHNGDRYMSIALDPYLDKVSETIHSANESVFKVKKLYAGSSSTNLSFALSDINHPLLFAFFGIGLVLSLGLLPLYEVFRLPYLGKPSLYALDWPEIFLIVLIILGILSVRLLKRDNNDKRSTSKMKIYTVRGVLLLIICLAFFTY